MLLHNKLAVKLIIVFYSLSSHVLDISAHQHSSKPLNILFVVEYFPAPSQNFILNIITGLIDNGHKVSIFAFHKHSSVGQHPNIEKYGLMDRVIYEGFPTKLPNCDIVFCQSGSLGRQIIAIDALAKWLANRKLVVCLRGNDITGNHIKDDPTIYKTLFKKADLFLPVCDYFKQLLLDLGCNPKKIVVYHSAVNCSQFFFKKRKKPKKDPIRLIAVCRLVEKKGLKYAIKAVADLIKEYKNIHFTIVGRGHLKPSLEALIKLLKLEDKVTLFGWATQSQVIDLLDKSHIFLLPSITAINGDEEGIANALKEAMAMGLISIGTWHAGTPELIEDGVSGFLVPEKNSKELSHKIKHVIEHPKIWKAIGFAARKKIEKEFEAKELMKQLEEIFYGLMR